MGTCRLIEERVGEKLERAQVFVHCFDGTVNSLISYKLIFDSHNFIVISIGPGGDSLKVDANHLIESDLEEFGSTRLLPVSQYDPATINRCLGRRLDQCEIEYGPNKILTIELYFEGVVIVFCSVDDNMIFDCRNNT